MLHYPSKDKSTAFNEALKRKLDAEDFNFCGVWFPDFVDFSNFTFTKSARFDSATFNAATSFDSATFSAKASFSFAKFNAEVSFGSAIFDAEAFFYNAKFDAEATFLSSMFKSSADFASAQFKARAGFFSAKFKAWAHFSRAAFGAEAYFIYATFDAEADFDSTTFDAVTDFDKVIFRDYVRFAGGGENKVFGDNSSLNLQFARIEKPDRISFHTLTLRPHWFVNVDARRFEFINVNWNWRVISTKQEIKSIDEKDVSSAHRLLEIACRNLAVNAEENHRYKEASKFRYMAMDAQRLERWRGFAFWRLRWWYWLTSGYGERVGRAFVMLVAVWLLSAALYSQVGFVRWETRVSNEKEAAEARRDEVGEPLRWPRPLTYSLGVMTLQKPEPRPATNAAQSLVMLETILGPVQAALLALAIRRKFMR